MKKIMMFVCALAVAAPLAAEQAKAPATAKYSGVVEKFDPLTKVMIVKKDDKTGEFTVTTTSEIFQGDAKAETTAIGPGQKAEIEFWLDGAKKMVKKVKLARS